MKRFAQHIAALALLALLSGCSTIQSKYGSKHRDENGMSPQFGYAYSGLVSWAGNWCYFGSPNKIKVVIAPVMFVFLLIDLPLTIAADTIALPFELPHEPTAPRLSLTDECNYSSMKLTKD